MFYIATYIHTDQHKSHTHRPGTTSTKLDKPKESTKVQGICAHQALSQCTSGVSLEHALYLTVDCTQKFDVRHSCWISVFYKTVVEQGFSRIPSLENMYRHEGTAMLPDCIKDRMHCLTDWVVQQGKCQGHARSLGIAFQGINTCKS